MQTVVFDLDGTLADTSRDLIAAANACFHGMGLRPPLDPVADAATAFGGGRAMLRLGLSRIGDVDEAIVDREYPNLLRYYEDDLDVYTRLYPGAVDAVETLRGAGLAVSVCTNKPEGLAEELLGRLGVRDLFGALIGADTLPVRKPDPEPYRQAVLRAGGDPGRSLLVGDTVTDLDTARAAGVPIVLVTFGPEGEAVADMKPDALLSDYGDLPGIVQGLLR